MNIKKIVGDCLALTAAGVVTVGATPPFMWYATHSIQYYVGNGCNAGLNLGGSHNEASGFSNAVQAWGLPNTWYRYNRRDTECIAARWSGTAAEVNQVDFLFYSGHGCGTGPYLGCSSAYSITNWADIRFGGNGYLKWVQGSACCWFVAPESDDCQSGMHPFDRWNNCFAGVHTIQGHRANTFDYTDGQSMSAEFWSRWVNGNTIYMAWREAQIHWVYEEEGNPGLQPATAAHDQLWGYELFEDAEDVQAPSGIGYLGWTTVGTPTY
ncbi:MAG: hypothetical protein JW863_16690 [Chitinispirillaceae bacterium]|nr:hypothetical protein [Chitinispirillaceae bacterium]